MHTKVKFTGNFDELKRKLEPLKGDWEENQAGKKVLRVNGGVLNWYESTGTLQVQGKSPGKELLEKSIPHLIYPEEYPEQTNIEEAVEIQEEDIPSESSIDIDQESIENIYLQGELKESELIIGIVNAVGTEAKRVLDPLTDRLKGFEYNVQVIRISKLLSAPRDGINEYERIKHYMNEGDKLRKESGNNAILVAGASSKINEIRIGDPKKTVYIVNSLKHPDEVAFLRKVYGSGFYLFGIHADEKRRRDYLVSDKSLKQTEATELIRIDEDEKIPHGQRTRDTYHLADFFISLGKNDDYTKNTIQRFLELIFSNPFINPTFDEFAMFMAFNSSIRSSDLSRQVGAVIAKNQQIIATGANDTPKTGGGQYWAEIDPETGEAKDHPDGKDYTREEDSNKIAQLEIIDEITDSLITCACVSDTQKEEVKEVLSKSKITDLTEFGRVVHAEMEALLSCAREGISTVDGTLYCTTFPCHNCAKHIVDAGISRVVYVEPYPKSRALDYHSEAIELKTSQDIPESGERVVFEPFTGVSARRFLDLFSMSLGSGSKLKRKDKQGHTVEWSKESTSPRTPLLPKSYLDVEKAAKAIWEQSNKHR
ncbi:MAG: hypothetical protein LGB07_06850 [Sulfurovum sp.]|nr:hypothetical protein [Sulfurovum sp.]MCB4755200.1 hypothetical protein [Sulfurovum sp.]